MESANSHEAFAREMLAAVRARFDVIAATNPAETTSPLAVRESLALIRALYRYRFDMSEDE
jgi:hypothetical protein